MANFRFHPRASATMEESELHIYMSAFTSVRDKSPKMITVEQFHDELVEGKYRECVERVRACTEKKEREAEKRKVPAVTFSGIFNNGHHEDNYEQHSGVICIDFDLDDNPFLADPSTFATIKQALCDDVHSLMVFTSISGKGLAAIVRIDPKRHLDTFNALEVYYLQQLNLVADTSCKDVTRLRFVSHDPDAFYDIYSRKFTRYSLIPKDTDVKEAVESIDNAETSSQVVNSIGETIRGEECSDNTQSTPLNVNTSSQVSAPIGINQGGSIDRIRKSEIVSALYMLDPDMDYNEWRNVGMALSHEFDGSIEGFQIFDTWSKGSAKYGLQSSTADFWKSFSKKNDAANTIQIETLFGYANEAGWVAPGVSLQTSAVISQAQAGILPTAELKAVRVEIEDITPVAANYNQFICPDYFMERGSIGSLVAQSGVGKSVYGFDLGLAWAQGVGVGGNQSEVFTPNRPLNVAYVQGENSEVKNSRMKAGAKKGYNLADDIWPNLRNRFVMFNLEGVEDQQLVAELVNILGTAYADGMPYDVLFLDPISEYFGGDENDKAAVRTFVKSILRPIATMYDCMIVMVQHTKKPPIYRGQIQQYDETTIGYAASGSAEWMNAPRWSVILQKETSTVASVFVGKNGDEIRWVDHRNKPTRKQYFKHGDDGALCWQYMHHDDAQAAIQEAEGMHDPRDMATTVIEWFHGTEYDTNATIKSAQTISAMKILLHKYLEVRDKHADKVLKLVRESTRIDEVKLGTTVYIGTPAMVKAVEDAEAEKGFSMDKAVAKCVEWFTDGTITEAIKSKEMTNMIRKEFKITNNTKAQEVLEEVRQHDKIGKMKKGAAVFIGTSQMLARL